jgi:protein SMG6
MQRTAEPESISDATSSSYAPRGMSANPPGALRETSAHQRQLFDHRKDDPVRFSVLARPSSINGSRRPPPTPKSSADYVSASSMSSYPHSQVSSTFTFSSNTTDGSSASSAVFDRPTEEPGNNAFAVQLKKLYRGISALEAKILSEDADDGGIEDPGIVVYGREKEISDEDPEVQKWNKLIGDHKRYVIFLIVYESF